MCTSCQRLLYPVFSDPISELLDLGAASQLESEKKETTICTASERLVRTSCESCSPVTKVESSSHISSCKIDTGTGAADTSCVACSPGTKIEIRSRRTAIDDDDDPGGENSKIESAHHASNFFQIQIISWH